VALKNYYDLLEIPSDSPAEQVRHSFRAQIARYHPDKVQHLGKEFQSMAADRAAELTEAYRILSDPGRRAEYDRALAEAAGATPAAAVISGSEQPLSVAEPQRAPASRASFDADPAPRSGQFKEERATRDEFVRKAALSRLRQALETVGGGYEETPVRGFDLALTPKKPLFGKSKNPKLLARFVAQLDRQAVADAWTEGLKGRDSKDGALCVLLLGTVVSQPGELAAEITNQRRRSRGARLTLIPVDARVWHAHIPLDAPAIARTLLMRLKSGS
jgi:curved DNA-binding protein CbpA